MKTQTAARIAWSFLALALAQQAAAGSLAGRASGGLQFQGASPVDVVSVADIESQGGTDIADLINRLPAVTTRGGAQLGFDPGTSHVNIRGLGDTRTLVLVNGRRVADSGYSFPNAQIPTALIDRIEVCTGGAAAVYGADAVGGVVNLITTARDHKRPALASENGGILNNPALRFDYGMSGTGYGVSAGFCLDSGRVLPFDFNINLSGYDLGGSASVSGMNFPEGLGVTGIGGFPGVFIASPTDILNGTFDADRNGRELSLDFGIPLQIGVHGATNGDAGLAGGFLAPGTRPASIGQTTLYTGLRAGHLNQNEATSFSVATPAFGVNQAWQADYQTDFKSDYFGAFVGLGYSRTFFGSNSTSTTLSLIGTVGYDSYNFDVSEQVDASGLGGALNYSNTQQHQFSDSLFSSRLTAAVDWRRDNLTIGAYASYDCGIVPEINRFLPDSDLIGALNPEYSLGSTPSVEIGLYARLAF